MMRLKCSPWLVLLVAGFAGHDLHAAPRAQRKLAPIPVPGQPGAQRLEPFSRKMESSQTRDLWARINHLEIQRQRALHKYKPNSSVIRQLNEQLAQLRRELTKSQRREGSEGGIVLLGK
jgi:hypothetical protein